MCLAPDAIVVIHGGVTATTAERPRHFSVDPEIRVLVATDAAGEGINLQNANLMVNYDLPESQIARTTLSVASIALVNKRSVTFGIQ